MSEKEDQLSLLSQTIESHENIGLSDTLSVDDREIPSNRSQSYSRSFYQAPSKRIAS